MYLTNVLYFLLVHSSSSNALEIETTHYVYQLCNIIVISHVIKTFDFSDALIAKFKFPGRGRQTIDVAPLATALEFAFLLPGKAAANIRRQAATLMVRYLGGDTTLVEEVYSNRRSQESLSTIPEDQRTVQEQATRLCGEAVEVQDQPAVPVLTSEQAFVPRKPLVIQDEDSVGLPGNDHLYAARRVGENIIKVGISKMNHGKLLLSKPLRLFCKTSLNTPKQT